MSDGGANNKKSVTLSGYYGFDNAGDEAVLAGLIKAIRAQPGGQDVVINALSINPAETERSHSVAAAHRYRVGPLLRSLGRTDLLMSGGGSLLQDVTSAHGIFYYVAVVRIAQMLGKKTMFAAQGIGPLHRARSRKLVAGVANRLDAVTVRDADSIALLRSIGVSKPPMEVVADPALLLPTIPESNPSPQPLSPPGKGAQQRPTIAVALRPWTAGYESLPERLARACAGLPVDTQVSTQAMQPRSDEPVLERFRAAWLTATGREIKAAANYGEPRSTASGMDLNGIIGELSASEMVIGMRLHALILAAGAGIPSVALAYDPKVGAFMRSTGQQDAVVNMDAMDTMDALIQRVWQTRRERSARLVERLPALRTAALRTGVIAAQLLDIK